MNFWLVAFKSQFSTISCDRIISYRNWACGLVLLFLVLCLLMLGGAVRKKPNTNLPSSTHKRKLWQFIVCHKLHADEQNKASEYEFNIQRLSTLIVAGA
jgi:hypothetical protein